MTELEAKSKKQKKRKRKGPRDRDNINKNTQRELMLEQGILRPGGSGAGSHGTKKDYKRRNKHRKDWSRESFETEDGDGTTEVEGFETEADTEKEAYKPRTGPYKMQRKRKKKQTGQSRQNRRKYYERNRTTILRNQSRYRKRRRTHIKRRKRMGPHHKRRWVQRKPRQYRKWQQRRRSSEIEREISVELMNAAVELPDFHAGDLAIITYVNFDEEYVEGYTDMDGFAPVEFEMSLSRALTSFLFESEEDLNEIIDKCVEDDCWSDDAELAAKLAARVLMAKTVAKRALQEKFPVAAIQHHPKFKDKAFNLWELSSLVSRAALVSSAKIIVLPELCTTGYSLQTKKEAHELAEPVGGPCCKVMGALSRKYGCYVAFGFIEINGEDKDGNPILHNSQALVGPEGTVLAIYRKQNLWGSDWLWATPGSAGKPPIVETPYGKIGLLICKDVRDKTVDGKPLYKMGDADIVCLSTNWGDGEFPPGAWVKFAPQNGCWLIVSNRWGGAERQNFFDGGTAIISPKKDIYIEGLDFKSNCIVTAIIDPSL